MDEKNQKIRTGREFKLKSRKTIQLDIELELILLTRRYGEKGRTEPGTTDTISTNDTSWCNGIVCKTRWLIVILNAFGYVSLSLSLSLSSRFFEFLALKWLSLSWNLAFKTSKLSNEDSRNHKFRTSNSQIQTVWLPNWVSPVKLSSQSQIQTAKLRQSCRIEFAKLSSSNEVRQIQTVESNWDSRIFKWRQQKLQINIVLFFLQPFPSRTGQPAFGRGWIPQFQFLSFFFSVSLLQFLSFSVSQC